ncbi:MAG: LysR substrate-binding domain-containing protein [Pyrinomonadaceae bacterium]
MFVYISLRVEHLSVASLERSLENGDVDIALGFDSSLKTPNYLCSQRLFDETMACVVRKDHPEIGEEMSLEQYVHMDHVSVSMSSKQGGIVDDWLAERGLERRVTLKIPHFLVAPFIVAQTDMVLSVPRRLAKQFVHLAPLKRASVNRCGNSSGGFPHKFLFYPYPIGIGRSLVDVF